MFSGKDINSQSRKMTRIVLCFFKRLFSNNELSAKQQALKITYIYFFIGCLWILVSDKFVEYIFVDRSTVLLMSIIKGLGYVFINAALIFGLIFVAMKKTIDSKNRIKTVNDELEKSNMLFSAILESSPDVIVFSLDNNYCYTAFNNRHKDTMLQIWGKEIRLGMNMLDVIADGEDRCKAKYNFDKALNGESFTVVEGYGDEKLLRLFWQDYYSPIVSSNGQIIGLTCFAMNITKLKAAQEKNDFLSYHDKLTSLYNRRYYEDELKRIDVEQNFPITIIMGDVNGLKLVNDAFGHQVGDQILKISAQAITSACRQDDIIARWGGDEFIILLPKTGTNAAQDIVKAAKRNCAEMQVNSIYADISFGWGTKDKLDVEIKDVIKYAEDMMYKNKIVESKSMRSQIIKTIMSTLHEKNPREEKHSKRVGELSKKIGSKMGLSDTDVNTLELVGYLHDIGKIAIEEEILNKPGKLTYQEIDSVKLHPEIGCRIIRSAYEITEISEAILAHHERWDGKGYPSGLQGEQIPKFSRIIAIADSYDAITSHRPYKKTLNMQQAAQEIIRNAGKQFDPEISRIFVEEVLGYEWDGY